MRGPNRESLIWTPWLWRQLRRPDWPCPGITPGARHDEVGRLILRPTAAWRDESQGVCLCTAPYPVGCSTGKPRAWTVRFRPEDTEEDGEATSALDAELDASTGEETDASGCPAQTSSAKWRRQRNRAMRRQRTRVWREFQRPKNRRLSFPLFRETTKEDAISYWDWHSEIEDALEHGHDAAKVKEVMFTSLEGMAQDNAKMIDENGDLHVTCILDGLDSLYGVSMTFQSLNAALCGLQQRQMESACAYYNGMVQITVILRERHGNRYRPGELARMSKDCFYAGLLPENRPMVVHLKDQPHTTPLDLLKALLEQEENDTLTRTWYPPSTSSRMSQPSKPVERYHRQLPAEKRNDGYTVRPAQLDTDSTRRRPRSIPQNWMTHWTPSRHGITTGSS